MGNRTRASEFRTSTRVRTSPGYGIRSGPTLLPSERCGPLQPTSDRRRGCRSRSSGQWPYGCWRARGCSALPSAPNGRPVAEISVSGTPLLRSPEYTGSRAACIKVAEDFWHASTVRQGRVRGDPPLRVCREPAELYESLLWIRSDRVVRSHVGGANLPLPVDDVPRRQRKAIRRFPVEFIKRFAE
jgi:hypothetical protein